MVLGSRLSVRDSRSLQCLILEVSRIQLRFLKDNHPLIFQSDSNVEDQYIWNG